MHLNALCTGQLSMFRTICWSPKGFADFLVKQTMSSDPVLSSAYNDAHLLQRPSEVCWASMSCSKSPDIRSQLGAPALLSKASWQALTWRRGRESRNLKTTFPLSEECAANSSACQLLRCSCQAVVLLCSPGSTNYTFVFSPEPALLLPQLNTLQQKLLQLWELPWESRQLQQPVDGGSKSGHYKPHGRGKHSPSSYG